MIAKPLTLLRGLLGPEPVLKGEAAEQGKAYLRRP